MEETLIVLVLGLILVVTGLVPVIVCPIVAGHKNRSVGGWLLGGLFLGMIGLIIICCLPDRD